MLRRHLSTVGPFKAALEIGCGPERLLSQLLPPLQVEQWLRLDQDARVISQLGELPGERLLQADVCDMPLPDNSVDLLLGLCVTDQVPDTESLAEELLRVLKPGGLFLELNDQTFNLPTVIGEQAARGLPQSEWQVPFPNPRYRCYGDAEFVTCRYRELTEMAHSKPGLFEQVLLPYLDDMPGFLKRLLDQPNNPEARHLTNELGRLRNRGLRLEAFSFAQHMKQRSRRLLTRDGFETGGAYIACVERPIAATGHAYLLRHLGFFGCAAKQRPYSTFDERILLAPDTESPTTLLSHVFAHWATKSAG